MAAIDNLVFLLVLVVSVTYASVSSCSEPIKPQTTMINLINPTVSHNTLATTSMATSPCHPKGTQTPPKTDTARRKIPRTRGSRLRVDPYILIGVGIAVGIALVFIAIIFVWRRRHNRYQNFDPNATAGVQDSNNIRYKPASVQNRRNSLPLSSRNKIQMPSDVTDDSYLVMGNQSKRPISAKKDDTIQRFPSSNNVSSLSPFNTICCVSQKHRRPTRLPPIDSIAADKKANKSEVTRKKNSSRKKSSKVHVKKTKELFDGEEEELADARKTSRAKTSKAVPRKMTDPFGYKRQEAADEKKHQKEKSKENRDTAFGHDCDAQPDDEPIDVQDFWRKETDATIMRTKSSSILSASLGKNLVSGEKRKGNQSQAHPIQIVEEEPRFPQQPYQLKVKSQEESKVLEIYATKTQHEIKLKMPPIVTPNDTQSSGGKGYMDSSASNRPISRAAASNSQVNGSHLQRTSVIVLPPIKLKVSGQFPRWPQEDFREAREPSNASCNAGSECAGDANKSHFWQKDGGRKFDSELERERQRIRKLCRAQNDNMAKHDEEKRPNYPKRIESQAFNASDQALPAKPYKEDNMAKTKVLRLPKLKPMQYRSVSTVASTSAQVESLSSCKLAAQRSASTHVRSLPSFKSEVTQGSFQSAEIAERARDTGRFHRESIQKLDVYEFLREQHENATVESAQNTAKSIKKGMHEVFQFLKTL